MEMKDLLKQGITEALNKAIAAGMLPAGDYPDVALEVPPQKEFGDFASNIAMQSARVAHKAPRIIAQAIVDGMDYPWLDHAEIAGAGFINFFLKNDVIYDTLKQILAAGDVYGHAPLRQEDTIQVEYVSANPTGPLHVGHGRGAAYGSALVNLLRAAGYNVQAEYYINDAGNQMNNLAASVNARYLELLGKPAEIPENGYHGHDIIETAQAIIDQDGDKYLDMPEAERLELFKDRAYAEKLKALKRDLAHFNVHYDNWFSERTLHPDAIQAACKVLEERGKIYEKDGALWLKSTDYGDDKDRVVIRDNGVPTYLAADIAYHKNKYDRGFKKIINIWGADHHGYVARVKAAMAALGYDVDQLEVLLLQMVSLFRDGKPVKMSKRTGQAITLNELIEEVGTDAARYFFIMRSLDTQLDFDLDLAKSHSNENPVYYIQYAHARIYSIYRQAKETGANLSTDWSDVKWDTLTNEYELELIKKMAAFPEEVQRAARERAPHRIAHFVHELAGMFHTFYNHCRIIQEDKDLERARLALVTAVRITIANSLAILGVSAPEKM
ncbi:arginine--tRNA ligase [Megasphaera elsdenii]|uniref:arginine--tRNA ligase n=1 Tax=Megasphaera elsdenii TaxID=907 RepID=UPI002E76FE79|nr:arginine--tRNA ligase [Megasphaera elsdenii]MEE0404774.1 arginine--tRNA ligase [Megasphaera elsdenii]